MGQNLLTVKSLVTLALTAAYIGLLFLGRVTQEITTIYMVVIGFYFGTQTKDKDKSAAAAGAEPDGEEADTDAV